MPSQRRATLVACTSLAIATAAAAQTGPATPEQSSPTPGPVGTPAVPPANEGGLFAPTRTNLFGDPLGIRAALGARGITLGLQETGELIGNATGGVKQGASLEGLTIASVGVDTARAFGWDGGTINLSAFQIHGHGISVGNLRSLQLSSSIEATGTTRLWELWFQQALAGGKADVKIGQQSIDQEFMISSYAATFINSALGWPVLPAVDMYAGGPAYPLSSLGVRARARPTDTLTLLAGVFDDNPPGGPFLDDSQVRGAERSGTRFNLGTGAILIAEAQLAINPPPAEGQPATGLAGTYKIGGWYDTGPFPDQRIDTAGLSLADPASTGHGRPRHGNFSLYAVADQTIWQPDPAAPRSIGLFARIMGAPDDRNLVSLSVNAGAVMKAPLPGRDNDSVGIGYGLAQIGRNASRLDRDVAFYTGTGIPVRSSESFVELTYQAQIAPWWLVQPDFQYVFTPGGGLTDPNRPGHRIGNAAVLALRTNITF
jgi:porin